MQFLGPTLPTLQTFIEILHNARLPFGDQRFYDTEIPLSWSYGCLHNCTLD